MVVPCTADELERYHAAAAAEGLPLSELVRRELDRLARKHRL